MFIQKSSSASTYLLNISVQALYINIKYIPLHSVLQIYDCFSYQYKLSILAKFIQKSFYLNAVKWIQNRCVQKNQNVCVCIHTDTKNKAYFVSNNVHCEVKTKLKMIMKLYCNK